LEAQTDIQDYLERGKQALAQGQARDAAIAFAHAAQIEPNNPIVHLGLAEANLALGSYGVVYLACRKVQELQPAGGVESNLAQSLLDLLAATIAPCRISMQSSVRTLLTPMPMRCELTCYVSTGRTTTQDWN
jgi:tetratricopeptide (TPR) repeat protein